MPNIASALKGEITRVSRKEIRVETSSLKKAVATYRSEIASLKRRTRALEQQLRSMGKVNRAVELSAASEDPPLKRRFSAKGLAAQRRRLGLSAADCGLLVGASSQSVYNWEEGKVRPRAQHLEAIAALNRLGRKDAKLHVEARKAA